MERLTIPSFGEDFRELNSHTLTVGMLNDNYFGNFDRFSIKQVSMTDSSITFLDFYLSEK